MFVYPLHLFTGRFHDAVRLFCNRSLMMSNCGESKNVAHEEQLSVSLMFLPHFDVFFDILPLNPRQHRIFMTCMIDKKHNFVCGNVIYVTVLQ